MTAPTAARARAALGLLSGRYGVGAGVVEPPVVVVSEEAVPLQLPAPQLDAPVEAVLSADAVPLHDDAPSPPVVELVDDSVVDELPEPLLPPPQADRPRSAVAATASEVFMFLFISRLSLEGSGTALPSADILLRIPALLTSG
jgi:hypothetical protein